MMKHGAVKMKNQSVSDSDRVSVVSDASVCELGPDQQRKGFVLEIDSEQQVCAKKLKKLAQTSLKASIYLQYLSRVPDLCMWEGSL